MWFVHLLSDSTELCESVLVTSGGHTEGQLHITGTLAGKYFRHQQRIVFANTITKTFIQTDKFLYLPGQEVEFRILTVTGPFVKVSVDKVCTYLTVRIQLCFFYFLTILVD